MAYNYYGSTYNNGYSTPSSGQTSYNYYDPQSTYGGNRGVGEWASSPVGSQYLEDNQQAAYTRWLASNGYSNYTGLGEFARDQYSKVKTGYEAALGTNENLTFQGYLSGLGDSISQQYARLTPEQRGENSRAYSPRARYIPR
jgi:hypothetical protein